MNAFAPAPIGHPLHRAFAADRLLDGLDDEQLDDLRAAIDARRGVSTVTPLQPQPTRQLGIIAALGVLPSLLARRAASIGGALEMTIGSDGTITIRGDEAGPVYVGSSAEEALRVLDRCAGAIPAPHRYAAE